MVGGCGSRTGLLVGVDESAVTSMDASAPHDAPADAPADRAPDTSPDTSIGEAGTFHCNSSQPGWSPVCPPTPPARGTTCPFTLEGIQCEYGDDENIACNTILICMSSSWQSGPVVPAQFCGHGQCAASFGEITNGTACPVGGLLCSYDEGSCACDVPSGLWVCAPREATCPFPRPRLGCPSVRGLIPEAGTTTTLHCLMLPCGYIDEDEAAIWQTRSTGNLMCGQ
jgi:hypothetical protein